MKDWIIKLPDDIDPRRNDTCDLNHIIDGLANAESVTEVLPKEGVYILKGSIVKVYAVDKDQHS